MREYAKLAPQFWIGPTGKAIRQLGLEAQVVSLYLISNPHATMLGVYYLPIVFIAHEVGLSVDTAQRTLQALCQIGFCTYDTTSEYIWVHEMAVYQISTQLKANDNQVKHINEAFQALPALPFLAAYYQKYAKILHLTARPERRNTSDHLLTPLQSPFEAPSKPLAAQEKSATRTTLTVTGPHSVQNIDLNPFILPFAEATKPLQSSSQDPLKDLRSQEQEQEQEKEQEQELEQTVVAPTRPGMPSPSEIQMVFEHWKTVLQHPQAKLDRKRVQYIQKALKAGYSVEQLCKAINGCGLTPHNMGVNDRGQRYDGLHVILRDADQIERFIYHARYPPKSPNATTRQTQANVQALQNWLNQKMQEDS